MELIGREKEIDKLNNKLESSHAELVAVLGRRRVGKTFLIREHYKKDMFFHFTGLFQGDLLDQLIRFTGAIQEIYDKDLTLSIPANWFDAFDMLKHSIKKSRSKKKKVIFLDEFPWMATNRSRFLIAFTDFWNSFASTRSDLVVVICGSSASWMINKVLKNKGGLHNRVTERIILEPFTLKETETFLRKKNVIINRQSILQLYMAIGGIPFYLDQINKGESVVQAMDRLCFQKGSLLQLEYDELFASLFNNSAKHEKIVDVLSKNPNGLDRATLLKKSKLKSGGGVASILDELAHSGFISIDVPFGKKQNYKRYKLKDFYTIFYKKYITKYRNRNEKIWEKLSATPSYRSWSGLAFENLCMYHIPQIKRALKIEGILSTAHVWQTRGSDEMDGAQIDLLIDRADGVINICEIKYSNTPFLVTKSYAQNLRMKLASFKFFSKSNKALFLTMITTHGVVRVGHSMGLVQNEVVSDDLYL